MEAATSLPPTRPRLGVWIDWYEDRVAGRVHSEEYELVFASVPDEVWDQGPAAANRWIKKHLPKENEAPGVSEDAFARLQQDPHGAAIRIRDGRAALAPSDNEDDAAIALTPQAIQAHQQTRLRALAARDLTHRLSNQRGFENITRTVGEFARLIAEETPTVASKICVVWEVWSAIGTFIERDDAVKAGYGGLTPQMDADSREALDQLWIAGATFITRFPTAKENERLVREARQSRADMVPAARIAAKAAESGLLDEELRRFLDVAAPATERSEGVHAEKTRLGFGATVRNMLVAFMIAAGGIGGPFILPLAQEVAKDAYKHSQSRLAIRDFVLEIEDEGLQFFSGSPPGYQAAWREFCCRVREWNNQPPPSDRLKQR